MARKKKQLKAKEPIRLRSKALANGNQSLYLDIYKEGKRSYEFLKLYLIPEATPIDKTSNEATLKLAEAIKAKKILEQQNADHGFNNISNRSKVLLIDWMKVYSQKKLEKGQSAAFHKQIEKAIRHLILYKGADITMREVNKDYCNGFIDYLNATTMAKVTTAGYFRCLNCALNAAVKEEIIPINPITKISSEDRIKIPESPREYLTIDEVKKMVNTPCRNNTVKCAYLFSCLCGLRLSDVKALTWGDLNKDGEQWRVSVLMKKTQKNLYLPLSPEALKWLPERGTAEDNTPVFSLPSEARISLILKKWAQDAKINKRVTFHTARHTNATMLLTLGADVYTVSKLLGHTQIKTTQIYAKIVDKKKDDAVNLIPNLTD